jgi:ABC-2 type transport system ATP-binding protein
MALHDLSLEIPEGQFFGLLGPNGSGKTTAIHLLTTLIQPTSGHAHVAGYDVLRTGVAVRREIGLVFQEPALDPTLSVEETLEFAGALRSLPKQLCRQRSDELLELFEIGHKRAARVATLSGGMKRALDLARSVLHRPRVLFLDEPTLGLDLPNRRKIWDYVGRLRRERGTTVLLSTHYLEEAEDCDQVSFLTNGRIIGSGRPDQLLAGLGSHVVELEGERLERALASLSARLGPCLRVGERALFRLPDEPLDVEGLLGTAMNGVRSVRKRRSTLSDVFLWATHPDLCQEILR